MAKSEKRASSLEVFPLVPALIAGGALFLRLYRLTAESFWFDEAYSVAFAARPLWDFSPFRLEGPPFTDRNLYHLLLHFWLWLGREDLTIRLLSVLIGACSVAGVYLLAWELFDKRVGLWSAALLALSPLHIWYSQEVRMYGLVTAFSLFSSYFFLRGIRRGRIGDWIAYILCAVAGLYTHTFAAFVILSQGVYVLYLLGTRQISKRRFWSWLGVEAVAGVLALPLLWGLVNQQQQGWWAWIDVRYGSTGLRDLLDTFVAFSFGTTFGGGRAWIWGGTLAAAIAILMGIASLKISREGVVLRFPFDEEVIFCLLYLLVPLGTIFVISQVRNMYVLRYLLPFLPPFVILMGRGVSRVRPLAWRVILAGAIFLVSARSLQTMYQKQQKEDWRGLAHYLEVSVGANDLIFVVDADAVIPLRHYYQRDTEMRLVWRGLTDEGELTALAAEAASGYENVWLVFSHTLNRGMEKALNARHDLVCVGEVHFTGSVDLVMYRAEKAKG
ncbi:MAG: glycosyltransferase family 39 protein [Anaerolineae bacterium]|nr:glycosyltransferase family 39 protein [Anaerolineae bacterium]